jgi:ATP-GRASP peptide maturase of grasp-with-spasm system
MICILSRTALEATTEDVIDWLKSWHIPYVRLNVEDIETAPLSISIGGHGATLSFQIDDVTIDPALIKVVWLRRWGNKAPTFGGGKASTIDGEGEVLFGDTSKGEWQSRILSKTRHLRREVRNVGEFIFDLLSSARWLSEPLTSTMNKLRVLRLAAECGIDVPDTVVSNDRPTLSAFMAKYDRVITKAIGEPLMLYQGSRPTMTYTTMVDNSMLASSQNDRILPTLLQECLFKEYEIRAFYLDKRFYSMAIFSQSDEQTSVDFRRYQFRRPNRTVPYKLPDLLSSKLTVLMNRLGLETGSVDLVKAVDGRFVFLEVNPVGQFGMVSYPCNYHLEHAVASALVRRWDDV